MTSNALRGWLELLRPPNLPTVPGDPLAGYLLASAVLPARDGLAAGMTVLIALCLYACGLLLNDVADLPEDRRARPERPLPSGRVSRRAAAAAAAVLALAAAAIGLALSPLVGVVACALLGMILFYTFLARRRALLGIVSMGACRGLSVLVGAAAAGLPAMWSLPVIVAAFGLALYVVALAAVARRETEQCRIGAKRFAPVAVGCAAVAAVVLCAPSVSLLGLAWLAALGGRGLWNAARLRGEPEPRTVAATVGGLVRDMTLMQAAFCSTAPGGAWTSAVVGAMWLVSYLLARRFYGS